MNCHNGDDFELFQNLFGKFLYLVENFPKEFLFGFFLLILHVESEGI